MSIDEGQTFECELERVLGEAGLGTEPHDVVGRFFQFGWRSGSYHEVLFGTIQALSISDEGGLCLSVSNHRFRGSALLGILYSNDKWYALLDKKEAEPHLFEGEFYLP